MSAKKNPLDISIITPMSEEVKKNSIDEIVKKAQQQQQNAEEINKYLKLAYIKQGKRNQALQTMNCGTFLLFKEFENEEKTSMLHGANFCKSPLCPLCAWRKHLQTSSILYKTIEKRDKTKMLYHLVLAIPNVSQIDKITLSKLKSCAVDFIKKELKTNSYFLRLEITFSEKGYHPHLHILLESDFIKVSEEYIKEKSALWKKYYNKTDKKYEGYTFFIRGIHKSNEEEVVQELTKYVLKPDKIKISSKCIDDTLRAITNLRKTSSAGNIKKLFSSAKKESLIEVDRKLRELKPYQWHYRIFEYINGSYIEKTHEMKEEKNV